ncbi:MAG: HxlR family transcriptional regulator [SAR92 bacterium BACL26 MAG-121220-bin70]|jgi:DNA-binding HxlR family transcriptional regulator|uniref:HxlR family transcriptional regulator n=1 Tax=SAR92 bacterium BACL26 MAG-121220-bin70 TaxID=1655626 RepID=A0A0R2U6K5_9GAMM|nr:MAG: HxlR family transcriptional regulator [SAR92 bacterium BACL26 MAG-121220-bin70]|tara:strand:- start:30 stop:371 length:342 start_codon:yes stop_codon:yes gene_type:complete
MTKQLNNPIANSLWLISGKWKISIIYNLRRGPIRFGELKRILSPITQQMLTKQLREMERDQLIDRKVFEVIPPKVEYSLTPFGKSLNPVLDSWCKWGTENQTLIKTIFDDNLA